jgi:hypothetical protein
VRKPAQQIRNSLNVKKTTLILVRGHLSAMGGPSFVAGCLTQPIMPRNEPTIKPCPKMDTLKKISGLEMISL